VLNRRQLLKSAVVGAAAGTPDFAQPLPLQIAGKSVELRISPVSAHTLRISLLEIVNGAVQPLAFDDSLVQQAWGNPAAKLRSVTKAQTVRAGELRASIEPDPFAITIQSAAGTTIQRLKFDTAAGVISFNTGDAPLLGLGEGGPQFDRRGSTDRMRSGQGGYQLRTHGGRVPIPWIVGTSGWALFIRRPFGTFDFTGPESKLTPAYPNGVPQGQTPPPAQPLPIDIFAVVSKDPAIIMEEYARLTGKPELAPLWSFGYQQSHRTLGGHDEIIQEAKTFRQKKLPCDTMIYLGTGFCPSGWNTNNGEWGFNPNVFPDPKKAIEELHEQHMKVALHVVIRARKMAGTVRDACDSARPVEEQPSCYWDLHRPAFAMGVDGWWPDEGDPLDAASRLARNRMYWEAPQLDRPNERPFALHRNGCAGMQRFGSFLWSGDVYSTWETLKTHIPVAINTGLSGVPYWGTDIAGFVPTKEFTAEFFLRWFQFAAFCPLFRSHGRTWKLRLPWQWTTGDTGPVEIANYNGAGAPGPADLHNPAVEPICRKYLELRYRMLPYLYSAARESTQTGMPIMRAMWLHYPDDPQAVSRGDQYLWGRDILVAPVVEQGAASRRVYLPKGAWYDFWTNERMEGDRGGGREITRPVDLETMPIYVRAGAILPLGPVKQYADEVVDAPVEFHVYAGADGSCTLYEDDGKSFNYRKGEWMGVQAKWSDQARVLSLRLAPGSRMLAPLRRNFEVKLAGQTKSAGQTVVFEGRPVDVRF
jgi:alpha-glucosidase (family GH31 glycosyl hydrolase)